MENDMGIGEEIRQIQEYLNQLQPGNTSISLQTDGSSASGKYERSFKYSRQNVTVSLVFAGKGRTGPFGTGSSFRAYRSSVFPCCLCI